MHNEEEIKESQQKIDELQRKICEPNSLLAIIDTYIKKAIDEDHYIREHEMNEDKKKLIISHIGGRVEELKKLRKLIEANHVLRNLIIEIKKLWSRRDKKE